ncbi:Inositol 2-dehydrogenase/D-chiro-inositol 3-dehydrogenase [Streptomyces microflavus]
MSAVLKAGLIGLGSMGRHHARVLAGLEGVELVGVVDPMGDKNGWAQGAPVLSTVEELIALGIDYAVVACPTGLHEEVGLQLADAGVCALIEKPLADTVEGARRLVEAFESRDLVAGVSHIERCNPALLSLRSRLEAGELGDVYQVVTRRQGPFPHRIADVGVVKDLATHDIDLTGWVTGQTYTSIAAHTVSKSGRPHEDMVSAVGQLSDGTMVDHLVNWLSPLKERFTSVTGERGCFIADTLTADLTFRLQRRGHHRMGGAARLPRGVRGRHDPLRHPQARAVACRATSFSATLYRASPPISAPCARGFVRSRWPPRSSSRRRPVSPYRSGPRTCR